MLKSRYGGLTSTQLALLIGALIVGLAMIFIYLEAKVFNLGIVAYIKALFKGG